MRILLPHRPDVRDRSGAVRLAEQNTGCGRGRETTAEYGSVLDIRDTVTDANGALFGEATASDTARLVYEQFHS